MCWQEAVRIVALKVTESFVCFDGQARTVIFIFAVGIDNVV